MFVLPNGETERNMFVLLNGEMKHNMFVLPNGETERNMFVLPNGEKNVICLCSLMEKKILNIRGKRSFPVELAHIKVQCQRASSAENIRKDRLGLDSPAAGDWTVHRNNSIMIMTTGPPTTAALTFHYRLPGEFTSWIKVDFTGAFFVVFFPSPYQCALCACSLFQSHHSGYWLPGAVTPTQ